MIKQRLDKIVSNATNISRKDTTKLIRSGAVSVNGCTVVNIDFKASPFDDVILLNNQNISYKENYYIMMNKPQGYLSATEDRKDKTVLDLISDDFPKNKISPAGRLDKDTEGFLFLTTDGTLAHNVTGPKNHIPKTYYVKLDLKLEDNLIGEFNDGIVLEDGYKCRSAKLDIIDDYSCNLTITEGKFHQVKRMFLMMGYEVCYLKRISIGTLKLDANLLLGEYRELTELEVEQICLKK